MPYSHPGNHQAVVNLIRANFPVQTTSIIDIGCGCGTYKDLLPEYTMDGIEVYEKYINDFKLRDRYREIFNTDVTKYEFNGKTHNLAIMGDVLEHLGIDDAKKVLKNIETAEMSIVVQVPYMYEQGIYDGNEHEIHLQPDLTHAVFLNRYAEFGFSFLVEDSVCGAYYIFRK